MTNRILSFLLALISRIANNVIKLFMGKGEKVKIAKPLKEKPLYTVINTSQGRHNMPKKQPCPMGHGWKKRQAKTVGGALYYCNKCKSSFAVPY